MKMEFDFEDVKSLTSKVMSIIGKLRISPEKCTDHVTDNARAERNKINPFTDNISVEDEQGFASLYSTSPLKSLERKTVKHYSDRIARQTISSNAVKSESENVHESQVVCSRNAMKNTSIYSSDKCKPMNATFNKSGDLAVSSEPLSLSTSYSLYVLSQSRAKLLDIGLGLSESLRKNYLNYSVDSHLNYSMSPSASFLTLRSDRESVINVKDLSNVHSEKFRTGSYTDSSRPMSSSNFSNYITDGLCCSGFTDDDSNLSKCSSVSDMELVKIRYDTTSSSVDNTSNASALIDAESSYGTNSFTEEFKHDIDFLAKSAYRTSTPDFVPAESVENFKTKDRTLFLSEKKGDKSCSRDSFLSMTDSLFLLPRKSFVHGLSPLCNVPEPTRENHSSSRVRVRRSLAFVSPSTNSFTSPSKNSFRFLKPDETVSTAPPKMQSSRSSFCETADLETCPDVRFSEDQVLPKFMFRDETEEAVYYLITKYIENSKCKW